ncbi:hypothetical protein QJS66_15825 [Kocuria rhizophila]|nr:hypothetical protein QJS66_15825 [Kocuria rhizophila]
MARTGSWTPGRGAAAGHVRALRVGACGETGCSSSHIVPYRPDQLEFEYMRWFSTGARGPRVLDLDLTALRVSSSVAVRADGPLPRVA